jgi:hypothetical protein
MSATPDRDYGPITERETPHGYWWRYSHSNDEPADTLTAAIMIAGDVAATEARRRGKNLSGGPGGERRRRRLCLRVRSSRRAQCRDQRDVQIHASRQAHSPSRHPYGRPSLKTWKLAKTIYPRQLKFDPVLGNAN